ncbi:PREDICTED: putative F-box only protein 9 isoform X2 [Tarenaya hassleriana]|uniref:putative F-box only protein 9 isoform X2 n=1 Tax=Tarenaya hassleriana TaxID=28532 RepID=UPI00053C6DCA|nr:PREDICTED: putative F-box only protein 9 isoform X2 [Tarenaya hassleriana]
MSLKIPSDLEEEILSRVPTKFLSRLRFVCKQWNSLFHDLIFIEKHLSNHASPQEFMLWHPRSFYSKLINVEIHLNSDNIALSSLKYHDLTSRIPPSNGRKICRIIHSDGLLLYVTNHGLEVSNPFLKQERSIQTVQELKSSSLHWVNGGFLMFLSSTGFLHVWDSLYHSREIPM